MQITIPFTYTASEIPPKCRKPRAVRKDTSLAVSIAEITADQAPIAIIERGNWLGETSTREYRWYSGCLWLLEKVKPSYDEDPEIQTAEQFLKDPRWLQSVVQSYHSLQVNEEALFERASEIVFIDGMRWVRTLEPEYRIRASINWTSLDVVFGDKHELGDHEYYRIDQLEDALEWIETAYGSKVQHFSRFEILIPEALRLPATPKREKFTISVTLEIEGRGVQGAVRQFVSDLGIPRYQARDFSYNVSNLQTGETATVRLPQE